MTSCRRRDGSLGSQTDTQIAASAGRFCAAMQLLRITETMSGVVQRGREGGGWPGGVGPAQLGSAEARESAASDFFSFPERHTSPCPPDVPPRRPRLHNQSASPRYNKHHTPPSAVPLPLRERTTVARANPLVQACVRHSHVARIHAPHGDTTEPRTGPVPCMSGI
jgi:hypothetical protein